jgi:hypothetical protein
VRPHTVLLAGTYLGTRQHTEKWNSLLFLLSEPTILFNFSCLLPELNTTCHRPCFSPNACNLLEVPVRILNKEHAIIILDFLSYFLAIAYPVYRLGTGWAAER